MQRAGRRGVGLGRAPPAAARCPAYLARLPLGRAGRARPRIAAASAVDRARTCPAIQRPADSDRRTNGVVGAAVPGGYGAHWALPRGRQWHRSLCAVCVRPARRRADRPDLAAHARQCVVPADPARRLSARRVDSGLHLPAFPNCTPVAAAVHVGPVGLVLWLPGTPRVCGRAAIDGHEFVGAGAHGAFERTDRLRADGGRLVAARGQLAARHYSRPVAALGVQPVPLPYLSALRHACRSLRCRRGVGGRLRRSRRAAPLVAPYGRGSARVRPGRARIPARRAPACRAESLARTMPRCRLGCDLHRTVRGAGDARAVSRTAWPGHARRGRIAACPAGYRRRPGAGNIGRLESPRRAGPGTERTGLAGVGARAARLWSRGHAGRARAAVAPDRAASSAAAAGAQLAARANGRRVPRCRTGRVLPAPSAGPGPIRLRSARPSR